MLHSLQSSIAQEREYTVEEEKLFLFLRFYIVLGQILYRGSFAGFSPPRGFPRINLCEILCGCACLSVSDPLHMVMMLNVLIYCINIKNITWYQIHPEISLCVAKTLLQLQPLEIRVSFLKKPRRKNIVILEFSL